MTGERVNKNQQRGGRGSERYRKQWCVIMSDVKCRPLQTIKTSEHAFTDGQTRMSSHPEKVIFNLGTLGYCFVQLLVEGLNKKKKGALISLNRTITRPWSVTVHSWTPCHHHVMHQWLVHRQSSENSTVSSYKTSPPNSSSTSSRRGHISAVSGQMMTREELVTKVWKENEF